MGVTATRGHGGTGPAASSWWRERQGRVLAGRITVPTAPKQAQGPNKGETLSPSWLAASEPPHQSNIWLQVVLPRPSLFPSSTSPSKLGHNMDPLAFRHLPHPH